MQTGAGINTWQATNHCKLFKKILPQHAFIGDLELNFRRFFKNQSTKTVH
jgi:hypothetical protein